MKDESNTPHRAAQVKCSLCGYEQTSVFPIEADDENLECSRCGNMSCEVIEDVPDKSPIDRILFNMLNMTDAGLENELDLGQTAAEYVAKHLYRMKAGATSWNVQVKGKSYLVTVKLL